MPVVHSSAPASLHGSIIQRTRTRAFANGAPVDGYHDHPSVRTSYSRDRDGWRTPTIEDAQHAATQMQLQAQFLDRYFHNDHDRSTDEEQSRRGFDDDDEGGNEGNNDDMDKPKDLSWKQRIEHVTWAWFTLTMATGGIANVLHAVPYRFNGLYTIGLIFFLVNIGLYIIIWAMIIARFVLYPWTFRASFTHPTESLFVAATAVSFGTILINVVEYGTGRVGPWLNQTVLVLFWIDGALAVLLSIAIYLTLWTSLTFTIARMTPIWIFPAYPLLIMGPHAANISAQVISHSAAIRVIIGGFTIQGIGFLVSLTIYSAFVYRLMTQKLPAEPLRPGMFVSVGPSAFTVSGSIGMAQNLDKVIASTSSSTFMGVPGLLAAQILRLCANWMSLWLWGLAWWFFFVSLLSNLDCLRKNHHMPFSMTWYSFIFPQTALTTATFAIAKAFDVGAIRIIGCVMTCLLILAWAVVVGFMIKAIINKQILWPEKGEDKSEGGFKARWLRTAASTKEPESDAGAAVFPSSRHEASADAASDNV
ncbi:voltage-dependent anion channel-domain-containing protein [Exophiala viscosa]|uniref:Voltage-dependent anion channel-domain-containing protein n=1 Tax=Exophiala viscosa TaxID=2486360 RepID=A0AAN6IIB5_9EURO|nr:voltage-dependent anion channel-domain-containing protein [Exophiala viscosa]KAI1627723.1 voltage-dependent anion channel-domain-containing protein [Exophiala viscosa]